VRHIDIQRLKPHALCAPPPFGPLAQRPLVQFKGKVLGYVCVCVLLSECLRWCKREGLYSTQQYFIVFSHQCANQRFELQCRVITQLIYNGADAAWWAPSRERRAAQFVVFSIIILTTWSSCDIVCLCVYCPYRAASTWCILYASSDKGLTTNMMQRCNILVGVYFMHKIWRCFGSWSCC